MHHDQKPLDFNYNFSSSVKKIKIIDYITEPVFEAAFPSLARVYHQSDI